MGKQEVALRIIIADQAAEVRQALRLVCQEHLKHCLVIEVAASDDLLNQMEITPPDIVLLEWELPDMRPSALLHRLKEIREQTQIIVLSNRPEIRPVVLDEDVHGFVYKGDPPDELIALLHQFMKQE